MCRKVYYSDVPDEDFCLRKASVSQSLYVMVKSFSNSNAHANKSASQNNMHCFKNIYIYNNVECV